MVYEALCADLAADINYKRDDVYAYWCEFACVYEFHLGASRKMAEYLAMNAIRYALDVRGRDAD